MSGQDRPQRLDEQGSAASLIVMAISLVILSLLILLGVGEFSGGGSGNGNAPVVAGKSQAEAQLKLCVEGRPSIYGNPAPTAAQQSACTSALDGQLAGGGSIPAPLPTTTTLPGAGAGPGSGLPGGTVTNGIPAPTTTLP